MDKHELSKFAQLMAATGVIYDKDLPEAAIELYWQSLRHFSYSAVAQALQAHRDAPDGGQFMPKPADIIRLLQGSGQDRGLRAWTKVEKAIAAIGSYSSVVFDDVLIHAVLEDMGGWIRLCHTSTTQLTFSSIEFQKRYQGFLTHPPKRHPKILVGQIALENARNGYGVAEPALIGDAQQARLVMETGGGPSLTVHAPNHPQHAATPVKKYLAQAATS